MSEKYTFALIGGDRRQAVVLKSLLARGHKVRTYALEEYVTGISGVEICKSYDKAVSGSDAVILPLPMTRDGYTLNIICADKNERPLLSDIIAQTSKNTTPLILGGLVPPQIQQRVREFSTEIFDYYQSEELQRKNALPSAEGALMVAMENTDKVIYGMRVLVSGYGRIARILADRLKKLGAHVKVAARRDEVLCEITMSGYDAVRTTDVDEMKKTVNSCDVIFNTVPSIIFAGQILETDEKNPLYVEIASSPGGIDIPLARSRGFNIIFASSLPGKYAPVSAGEYIFETIRDILTQRGMNI